MLGSYEDFKTAVLKQTAIDLSAYKEAQMKRRIDGFITKQGFDTYLAFAEAIRTNKPLLESFVNYLTINVSEFWRNPDQWQILEKQILPELIKNNSGTLKIWSAACSTGDEPYSLVMLLEKFMPLSKIRIFATDLDKQVLEKARAGLYSEKSLKGLPKELMTKHFRNMGGDCFAVSDEVKRCVEFKEHNLLKDAYPTGCDLIVCRNVLIYFTEEAKDEIFLKFNKSLRDEGVLFLGSTEQIIQPRRFGYKTVNSFFYQKTNV